MMIQARGGMALVLAISCLGLFLKTEAATIQYRSVGAGATAPLASGSSTSTIDVNGINAVFNQTLPITLVLGDVVQYDTDNNGSVDTLAVITELTDAQTIKLQLADGGVPANTSGTAQNWAIYRAYTSLSSAITGMENTGIETGLRDFDPFFGGNDLVGAGESWVILCCSSNQADTIPVMINGWTTNALQTLTIKTPAGPPFSYDSHRHVGRWTPEAYRFITNGSGMEVSANHVLIEGLQFGYGNGSNSQYKQLRINHPGSGDIYIGHNLFAGKDQSSANNYGIQIEASGSGTCTIWNNIFYDFLADSGYSGNGIRMNDPDVNVYTYNNTVYNCKSGFNAMQGSVLLQNNIAQQCGDGYEGSFVGASGFNISDLPNDAPNNNLSLLVQFLNTSVNDFHLAAADTVATDAGVDLASNPQHSFNDDCDGQIRSGGWDIGADEGGPVLSPTNTPAPTSTFSHTPTITPTPTITSTETATPFITATPSQTTTPVWSATATATRTHTMQATHVPSGTLHIRGNVLRKLGSDKAVLEVHCSYSQALLVRIYNQRGELVKTLLDEQQARGTRQAIWEGLDRYGQYVSSGVYVIHVRSEEINLTRKLVVVR